MNTYEIPRNYKGEGRILYIFSTKGLIYTAFGILTGLPIYLILRAMKYNTAGFIIMGILGFIGFAIGTFKIPESSSLQFTKKTGGENIDTIIVRWLKFKKNHNKIYIYKELEEGTKDEQQSDN